MHIPHIYLKMLGDFVTLKLQFPQRRETWKKAKPRSLYLWGNETIVEMLHGGKTYTSTTKLRVSVVPNP